MNQLREKKECYFCNNSIGEIDYKDTALLQKFFSSFAKILPKKRTGVCTKHQRKLTQSIKRARFMTLLPYIPR